MLVLAALLAAAAPVAIPTSFSPAERIAAQHLDPREITGHERFLADDLLEGRKPGTRGDELAVLYLAAQLEALGLAPGGDRDTFVQKVPMVELRAKVPAQVAFRTPGGVLQLAAGKGVSSDLVLDADAHVDVARVQDAPLVFVGYGITAPEYGWDDYRDADVRGKIAVVLNFNPPFAGEGVRLWYGRWDYKFHNAAAHGAIGTLVIHTTQSAGYPWQVLSNSAEGVRVDLHPAPGEPRMQFRGWITEAAALRLSPDLAALRAEAQKKGFRPRPLAASMSLEMPVARRNFDSANVVGVLRGTDPKLAPEVVLYTAHHDHLGRVDRNDGSDGIFNGALDNASGCATVLAIAHAATWAPPKRSLVFAFVTAEESGLLGSEYLAQHPPVPAAHIAADINLDSVNIWGATRDLGVFGLGKSNADEVVRKVAAEQGRTVHGDPHPDRGSFYRSDMFSLARVGVPPVAVKGGPDYVGRPQGWGDEQALSYEQKHYHQPSDEFHDQWDLSGIVQDAQLQLVVGLRIANAPQLPRWKQGDEFEKARVGVR